MTCIALTRKKDRWNVLLGRYGVSRIVSIPSRNHGGDGGGDVLDTFCFLPQENGLERPTGSIKRTDRPLMSGMEPSRFSMKTVRALAWPRAGASGFQPHDHYSKFLSAGSEKQRLAFTSSSCLLQSSSQKDNNNLSDPRESPTEESDGANGNDEMCHQGPGGWSYDAVANAPNALSLARLISGPFIGGLIIHGHISTAVPLFLISGATDWLDGYLARKQGLANNILGSYLDPLADKVLVGSVVCSMAYTGLLSPYVFGVILGRDVCLIAGAFYARADALQWTWPGITTFFNISGTPSSSHESAPAAPKAEPLFISKVNTVVQITLISSCLAESWVGWPEPALISTVMEPATVLTTVWSMIAYLQAYRSGNIRLSQNEKSQERGS